MAPVTKNMTQGKPFGLILSFAFPLVLGNIFQQLYTVVDTMVVGKALGVQALAALGASDWLNWMMLSIIQGFTQGFGIRMAQQFGASRMDELRGTVGASAILSAAGAGLLLLAGQLAIDPVLELLHTPWDIRADSALYLRIMFAGVPVVMVYNLLSCVLRSLGDGQTPLQAITIASIVNIVLDLLFVLVFHWGIAGAAIATVIAQACSGVFCFVRIRKLPVLAMEIKHFRLEGKTALSLLGLGWPLAFQNAIISVGGMIVQTVVNKVSVIFIAGFTATNKLYGLLEIAATSYGYAMITYTGQNLGAGKPERIRKGQRAAIAASLITSMVIAAVMILLGKPILLWFLSGTEQEVRQALQVAYFYLVMMSLGLPSLYILHVCRSTLQGLGNTVLPMASGIAEFLMRTGTALLLPAIVGDTGIFYAEILAWVGADLILIPSYFYVMSRTERAISPSKHPSIG